MLGLVVPDWPDVLDFWFGSLNDTGQADDVQRSLWFQTNAQFDAECRTFEPLLDKALTGNLEAWRNSPKSTLAYIVLCDQLPRNIFRGTAAAFKWDPLALAAARSGVAAGQDRTLALDERAFFYMPFEHSERMIDQYLAVGLFATLRDEAPGELRSIYGNMLRFAQQHRDIILRFGRYPHRNAVLGRESSSEELAYIASSDGFGQTSER